MAKIDPKTGLKDKNYPAHYVEKGDPRVNGPYLDDIRAAEEDARREMRKKGREALNRVPVRDNERELVNARKAQAEVQENKNKGNSVDNPTPVAKTPAKKTAAKKATSGKKTSNASNSNK